MPLNKLTIEQAHQGLKKKEFSSADLTRDCLEQIDKKDPELDAFLNVFKKEALVQAADADKKIKAGDFSYLTGIPLAIKDNMLIEGHECTAGSKILKNYIATYDAEVVKRLRKSGAVFLGKTNMDEFAMGSSTENSAYKKTKNPWDKTRVPGGSSGGSAVAVAADMCLGALGSDTGSSVRQPASFCGVVGLKPTYGRVSRNGLVAMTSSLDQIGPITKNIKDNAILYQAIAGYDASDSTSVNKKVSIEGLDKDIKGIKIGVPEEYFIEGMDPEVQKSVEAAIAQLKKIGAKIVKVSLPLTKYALAVYQITVTSEISANLARFDGIRYGLSVDAPSLKEVYAQSKEKGLGPEAKRRIILGTFALSAGYYDQYYVQAQKLRQLIAKEFRDIFKKVDCLATPTAPSVAFKLGEKFNDPLMMYLSDIYTCPANIGGVCAISLPCGPVNNLPVGLQLIAKPFDEELLFRAGNQYEQATVWHKNKPGD
ncbi:MAG: Asp-tRNA(Asn)/Glu-tRNA(Gln) amidotransferase subunit GatA [Patescibacteria group bacterium]